MLVFAAMWILFVCAIGQRTIRSSNALVLVGIVPALMPIRFPFLMLGNATFAIVVERVQLQ